MGRCPLPLRATALIAAWLTAPLAQAGVTQRFCGYAYDLEDGSYRYTEHHEHTYEGDRWLRGTIDYAAPDGSLIGRKALAFEDPFIPTYRLELFGGRYVEGIERVGDHGVTAVRREFGDSALARERIAYAPPAAADSGFHALIAAHLPELAKGGVHRFDFVVAGALDRFRFLVRKTGDTRFEDRDAVTLLAEPDSLLSWIVDGLELTYDPATGQLLEYRGPTNLRDGNGEGYDVRIVFSSSVPSDAPAAAVSGCDTE